VPTPAGYEADTLESLTNSIRSIVEQSVRYKDILAQLEAGTISYNKAGRALSAMHNKTGALLQKQALLEAKLAAAIEHRGSVTNKQFANLIKKLTNVGEKIEGMGGGAAGEDAKTLTPDQQITAVMDAFRAGAISIERANELITSIKSGAGQGLAGFGDVAGALKAFNDAKSNEDILAAMKNLGIEAK
jgi:hypothetical protein